MGYHVLGGILDSITHLDAFLLNQAPVGCSSDQYLASWKIFLVTHNFAKFWKPPEVKGGEALGSPIFPSGCEGKLGVALESLQGLRDLT